MKVLIVSPCGLPVPAVKGGAVLDLIETLVKENEQFRHAEFTIVSSYDPEAVEVAKKYKYSHFVYLRKNTVVDVLDNLVDGVLRIVKKVYRPHSYFWKLYALKKQQTVILRNEYDAVVFENAGYLLNSLKNKRILEKYKDKLFFHIHNDVPDNIYAPGLKQCKILSISKYLKKKLDLICGELSDDQFLILHNGFDCKQFMKKLPKPNREDLLNKLDISPDKKIVIFAGRITPQKGIDKIVEAFEILKRDDTVLLVLGSHNFASGQSSPFEKLMKKKFAELEDRVVFTGYVNHDDIWKYYKIADVAVLPSMWEEPAGLTIMEAMASGLPVISTVSGGIPEFLTEDYGILLERDENISQNIAISINEVLDNLDTWKCKASGSPKHIFELADKENYYKTFISYITG